MAMGVPTPDEVDGLFRLVREATRFAREMDWNEFGEALRSSEGHHRETIADAEARWQYNIRRSHIDQSVSLFYAAMEITIVKDQDGQKEKIEGEIRSFSQPLADLVPPGATTRLHFRLSTRARGPPHDDGMHGGRSRGFGHIRRGDGRRSPLTGQRASRRYRIAKPLARPEAAQRGSVSMTTGVSGTSVRRHRPAYVTRSPLPS